MFGNIVRRHELPELGTLNRGEIAKLAGVAPMNNDTGQKQGDRKTFGGRACVRSVLCFVPRSGPPNFLATNLTQILRIPKFGYPSDYLARRSIGGAWAGFGYPAAPFCIAPSIPDFLPACHTANIGLD